ncbi:hypothetical protein CLAFUW4_11512 [Fulvia fulva]|nr:hypothetical protein CLAFUR4_11518 [Fulvia fulva]WPV17550.1 hypothetical protein CLAFUW4_11512 [Fulvia fulva]WPV32166.1 hypothetical protein CLAFUW7_11517 [Fulvia fulva]
MSDLSVARIIAQLAAVDFNAQEDATHFLQLEYPVGELLPDTIDAPYLMEPLHVAHRNKPAEERTSLGLASPTFFVELPKTECPTCQGTRRRVPQAMVALMSAINECALVSGHSKLQVVSFFDDLVADLIFRIRLTTKSMETVLDFELTSPEMDALFGHTETIEWIAMLDHLITRASDRACYHVHDHLLDFDPDILDRDEYQWNDEWDRPPKLEFSPQELYLRKVSPRYATDGDAEDLVDLKLPCSHTKRIALDTLKTLTFDECLSDCCNICKKPVLSVEDCLAYRLAKERREADASVQKNHDWTSLDHSPNSESRGLHTASLSKVLVEALASFEAPTLLCPASLSLTSMDTVRMILDNFTTSFSQTDYYMAHDPERLVALLLQFAVDTPVRDIDGKQVLLHQTSLHPGLVKGLVAWLTRAVNFLAERQCRNEETDHLGFHHHSSMLMYNSALWEIGEEGEAPLEDNNATEMGGLEAAMTETSFIGATPNTLSTRLGAMDLDHQAKTADHDRNVENLAGQEDDIL